MSPGKNHFLENMQYFLGELACDLNVNFSIAYIQSEKNYSLHQKASVHK